MTSGRRLRILCCLNRDLASNVALNLLLPSLAHHDVKVGLTERVGGGAIPIEEAPERRELRIAEQSFPNDVLFPLIEKAALPDRGRYLTFAEVARYRGIPVEPLLDPNGPSGLDEIGSFGPDLILSIRYGAILKPPVISIPTLGVLNLHSGLLPDFRGVLATFRALMADAVQIGCTLHYVSDGTIDTGPIVGVTRMPVERKRSLLWHILSLYPLGVQMIANVLTELSNGVAIGAAPQDTRAGHYFSYPTTADWVEFGRRGWLVAQPSDLAEVSGRYRRLT